MTSYDFTSPRFLALLCSIIFISLFINLGGAPLFDEDEGAYSEVSREMLASGDFITPRLNNEVFFHKPPVIYWTQAISARLLGLDEFSLRLPSVIASLFWALAVFMFVRRHLSASAAVFAVFFLTMSMQTHIIAKAAIADAWLNLFITLTMFSIYRLYETREKRYIYLTFLSAGLGFMSKGPIALMIPVLTSGCFFMIKKQFRFWGTSLFNPIGIVIFLVIVLPWYLAAYMIHGQSFIDTIFLTHNVDRFNVAFEGHSGPFYYYIPVILLGMLPNTAFLPRAASKIKSLLENELNLYLLIWFVVVFIFFSVAGTKLHHYIIYGYVPLFIFMAQAADQGMDTLKHRLHQFAWPFVFLCILFFLPDIASHILPRVSDAFSRQIITGALPLFGTSYKLILGSTIIVTLILPFLTPVPASVRTFIMGVLFILLINLYMLPMAGEIMQSPVKEAALLAREKGLKVTMWKMHYLSFSVYYENPVPITGGALTPGEIIITKVTRLKLIKKYKILYTKFGIVLVKVLEY